MKKIVLFVLMLMLTLSMFGCTSYPITYSENTPMIIEVKDDTLKILQITDLHLAYGIDHRDLKTLKLISQLAYSDDYDLIVITGDLTMSPSAPRLFTQLLNHMESLKIPWTFVFGNHETDFHTYGDFLRRIHDTEYLHFKGGPKLIDGGYGNFKIEFTKNNEPFYSAYFLDSKAERDLYSAEEGQYDYLSSAQVKWYEDLVALDTTNSIAFMHIPLRQFIDSEGYVGIFSEDMVYAQGVDTGFFDAMVTYGKTVGVFVGHDHKNDFHIIREGIFLAYGRATGYNGYGQLARGGRHIEISALGVLTSKIVESEVNIDEN